MKRKIILALTLAIMLIAIFAISVSAAEPVETWDISKLDGSSVTAYLYEDTENSGYYTLTISGTGNAGWKGDAPWYASYGKKITSVTINEGVTNVASAAFNRCSALVNVNLPSTIEKVESLSFAYCSSLTSIEIPYGTTSISSQVFIGCSSLTEVVIPSTVTSIGGYAFEGCTSLETIFIPESVTHIGSQVFYGCFNLVIYCEADYNPGGYTFDWNDNGTFKLNVLWGSCGHDYDSGVVYNPTCESDGYTALTCQKCGYVYKLNITDALGHSYGKPVVVAPTCTEKGYTSETCSTCQKVNIYDYVSATGHNYDKTEVVAPTCTTKGYTVYTCANCGNTYEDNYTDEIEHSYNEVVTAPTCSKRGYTTYTCTACGYNYNDNYTDVVAHSYKTSIVAPTCTKKGYTNYTCTACGYSYRGDYTDVIEHSYKTKVIAPTCTAEGYTIYVCAVCNSRYTGNYVNATGHNYSTTVTAPTCINSGYTDYICVVCNDSYRDDFVAPKGHSYVNGKCECGATEATMIWDISADSIDSVVAYISPDADNDGYYILTISGTGRMKELEFPKPWASYNTKITKINIENGVTNISKKAFTSCPNLTSVTVGNDVTSIGYSAFSYCKNLSDVTLGNGLISIGEYAFESCSRLTEIVIPNSVTDIGASAFSGSSLMVIYFEAQNTPSGWESNWSNSVPAVLDCNNNDVANDGYVHLVVNDVYYGIQGGTAIVLCQPEFIRNVEILSSIDYKNVGYDVISVVDGAFANCIDLESIKIPNSVLKIGHAAFNRCTSLTKIVIPEGVTSIGDGTFGGCTSLTEIVIPVGVTSIGVSAFSDCTSLTEIVIPVGVTSIGDSTFSGCTSLTEIVIPVDVTSIGNYAFLGCTSLTEIVIPVGVTSIGGSAFSHCTSLTEIVIPVGVTNIRSSTFSNCTSLTEIVIPVGVTSIGGSAFLGCTSLTEIVIPVGVTKIESSAFYKCENLTIYCEATSKPTSWYYKWNASNCPVVWGHVHKAENSAVNNGSTHTGDCSCGLIVTVEHLFENWVKINNTTKQSTCICGAKNKMTIDEVSDKVKIDIVVSKDTFDSVGTVLIPEILEMIEGKEFELSSTEGTIILDAVASSKIAGTSGKVSIGIKDVTTDTETKNGQKVYSIVVNDENGNPILPSSESSTNGTVTLSLKYYKGLVKEQIKVAYRDDDGKLEYMQVESYNAETGEITFKTNHLSDYVVYSDEIDANTYLEKIFTFKGYSFNENGAMAVGFDVDYESLEIYESLTGETVRIGVAFASYILLNGQNPINDKGQVITLAQGAVAKRDLTSYRSFTSYDFIVQGITEALREHPLVIAAYLSNGEDTKFVQAGGISDTVTGITYNEAKGGQQ